MAMTYTSLTAAKGITGSVANWVNYTKLDIPVIVDEAQAMIYTYMRTREMTSQFQFNVPIYGSVASLPANFLDHIGRIMVPSINMDIAHKDAGFVMRTRNFTETSGVLGTNPFTTTNGSTQFSVNLPGHGFNQESSFNISGATFANGINFNGTFLIVSITDANDFVCDTLTQTATGSGADGGSTAAYLCDNLQQTFPQFFAIWDEAIHFEGAFTQGYNAQLLYFRSLPLLSATNQSNFLTNRYPHLMRTACQAAAADFMKDDIEYQKCSTRLQAIIQTVMVDNDGQYRGLEIDAETP
jgi:hypothetical protein